MSHQETAILQTSVVWRFVGFVNPYKLREWEDAKRKPLLPNLLGGGSLWERASYFNSFHKSSQLQILLFAALFAALNVFSFIVLSFGKLL